MRRRCYPAHTVVLALFIALPALAAAQKNSDIHITHDSARDFFHASSWAHGYIHGYEQGFHLGDVDLHLGKSARNPEKDDTAKIRMRKEYGDRKTFKKGFKKGLMVGYSDAYSGREFRAFRELRRLAQGIHLMPADKNIDEGLDEGYKKGLAAGLYDARTGRKFDISGDIDPCKRNSSYCAFHDRGVRLGYSDGYWNQSSAIETRTARK